MDKPIIWLASYPKSGNTWLRIFLAAYATDGPVSINHLPLFVGASDVQPGAFQAVSLWPTDEIPLTYQVAMRGAALLQLVARSPMQPAFIKTHWRNIMAWGIPAIPEMLTHKAVYLTRDPRDVCVSLARHNGTEVEKQVEVLLTPNAAVHGGEKSRYGKTLFSAMGSWAEHVESWQRTDFPCHHVRYEDMVAEPVRTFTEILKFLAIWDVDKNRVQRAVKNTGFKRLQAQEQAEGFLENRGQVFFKNGKPGGWADVLTEDQITRIHAGLFQTMEGLGYAVREAA